MDGAPDAGVGPVLGEPSDRPPRVSALRRALSFADTTPGLSTSPSTTPLHYGDRPRPPTPPFTGQTRLPSPSVAARCRICQTGQSVPKTPSTLEGRARGGAERTSTSAAEHLMPSAPFPDFPMPSGADMRLRAEGRGWRRGGHLPCVPTPVLPLTAASSWRQPSCPLRCTPRSPRGPRSRWSSGPGGSPWP